MLNLNCYFFFSVTAKITVLVIGMHIMVVAYTLVEERKFTGEHYILS